LQKDDGAQKKRADTQLCLELALMAQNTMKKSQEGHISSSISSSSSSQISRDHRNEPMICFGDLEMKSEKINKSPSLKKKSSDSLPLIV